MEEEECLRNREQEILKAREGLSEEKLTEYRDIFSFFDRYIESVQVLHPYAFPSFEPAPPMIM